MSTKPRIIREKETFRTETIVNVDGEDIKFYTKSSVNYERLTFKVQPVITLVHGSGKDMDGAILDCVKECRDECKKRLDVYREEAGIGTQGDLFTGDSPAPAEG